MISVSFMGIGIDSVRMGMRGISSGSKERGSVNCSGYFVEQYCSGESLQVSQKAALSFCIWFSQSGLI